MKKMVLVLLTAGSLAHASEHVATSIETQEVEVVDTQKKDSDSTQFNIRGVSMGKTSGAAIMSVLTGGLMTGALRLVKDFDGMSGPFTYALLAGALLVSLYDMVGRSVGPEYSGAACWGALASTISAGLLLQAALD